MEGRKSHRLGLALLHCFQNRGAASTQSTIRIFSETMIRRGRFLILQPVVFPKSQFPEACRTSFSRLWHGGVPYRSPRRPCPEYRPQFFPYLFLCPPISKQLSCPSNIAGKLNWAVWVRWRNVLPAVLSLRNLSFRRGHFAGNGSDLTARSIAGFVGIPGEELRRCKPPGVD
jgi:hypothetical protein